VGISQFDREGVAGEENFGLESEGILRPYTKIKIEAIYRHDGNRVEVVGRVVEDHEIPSGTAIKNPYTGEVYSEEQLQRPFPWNRGACN